VPDFTKLPKNRRLSDDSKSEKFLRTLPLGLDLCEFFSRALGRGDHLLNSFLADSAFPTMQKYNRGSLPYTKRVHPTLKLHPNYQKFCLICGNDSGTPDLILVPVHRFAVMTAKRPGTVSLLDCSSRIAKCTCSLAITSNANLYGSRIFRSVRLFFLKSLILVLCALNAHCEKTIQGVVVGRREGAEKPARVYKFR
jgi:hypothetical protein